MSRKFYKKQADIIVFPRKANHPTLSTTDVEDKRARNRFAAALGRDLLIPLNDTFLVYWFGESRARNNHQVIMAWLEQQNVDGTLAAEDYAALCQKLQRHINDVQQALLY
jgi:hypothetical protein